MTLDVGKTDMETQDVTYPRKGSMVSDKFKEEHPTDTSYNQNHVLKGEKLLSKTDQKFFFKTINNNMKKRLAKVVLNHSYNVESDFLTNAKAMNAVKKLNRKSHLGFKHLSQTALKTEEIVLNLNQKKRNLSSKNIRIKKTNSFFD